MPPTQPVPSHLIFGKFVRMCIDNKIVNTLGNYSNWVMTFGFLKLRNKVRVNVTWFCQVYARSGVCIESSYLIHYGMQQGHQKTMQLSTPLR